MSVEKLSSRAFNGWKGWIHYLKCFSKNYRVNYIAASKEQRLRLYYSIQKLIKEKCTTYGMRESKRIEFQFYFRESKTITDPQDMTYFMNTMTLVKEKLESGEYPPFPRRLPTLTSHLFSPRKDLLMYRKWIMNIDRNDVMLEPGQDPLRHPFIEPRQYSSDAVSMPEYTKSDSNGIQYPEEELLFGNAKEVKKEAITTK